MLGGARILWQDHRRAIIMRLTLRTLLAYLDDILEPEQAREIGKKASESPSASTLIGRIREVTRRRRLTAPALSGPGAGLDPNVVAEYLDNTLPAEGVGDVEQVCLESDVHLAEVVACHQVLTLVLGEPVTVVSESRERMYALGTSGIENVLGGESHVEPQESSTAMLAAPSAMVAESEESADGTTGRALSEEAEAAVEVARILAGRTPLWKRILPYVVVSQVVGLWLALFFLERRVPDAGLAPSSVGPADTVQEIVASREEAGPTAGDSSTGSDPDMPPDGAGLVVPTVTPPDAGPTSGNSGDTSQVPTTPPSDSRVESPGPVPLPETLYTSPSGVLLRRDGKTGDWMLMPRDTAIRAAERLAVPAPFTADVSIGGTAARLTMQAGTVVTLNGADNALCDINLTRGRIVLRCGPPSTGEIDPPKLRLTIGKENWQLELVDDDTVCGMDVQPRFPSSFEQDLGPDWFLCNLYVAAGTLRLTDNTGRTSSLGPGHRQLLGSADRAEVGADPPPPLPDWVKPMPRTASQRMKANRFEKQFDSRQPIRLSVAAAVKSPQRAIASLAVQCLALTGQVEPLVQVLAESIFAESRQAAFDGLRLWLVAEPGRGKRLQESLRDSFEESQVSAVFRLLWGFNKADGAGKETSRQLVDWLSDGHVAIREMAFYHVSRMTGRKNDYRADASSGRRQAAVARWRLQLKRTGSLVDP